MKLLLTLVGYTAGAVASLYIFAAGAGLVAHGLNWVGVPPMFSFALGMLLFGLVLLAAIFVAAQVAEQRIHQREAPTAPTSALTR